MITKSDIKTLLPHKKLNPLIWKDKKLNTQVKEKLLKIAHDFYVFLDIAVPILDITLTGSLANFNYTSESDIDLHIIIDYSDVDSNIELVELYMRAKKTVWNDKHDIRIKGHEVELYAQNNSEDHHSTGVFSILNNEWINSPEKGGARINMDAAKKKTRSTMTQIDNILQSPDRMKKIEKMKEKIRDMRSAGLKRSGEYSAENLAFKLLRRTGYLKKMYDAYVRDYDSYMSLDESQEGN
jgi:predicted nucleotidyltransferase